jgi:Alw26I/Eco31I/Esp3I family type II restriction m6 adenine DNA methyltransferase
LQRSDSISYLYSVIDTTLCVTDAKYSIKQNTFVMPSPCRTEEVVVSSALNEIAWSILSGFHKILTSDSLLESNSTLQITEASRLAGLTYVLSSQQMETSYSFSHLSYEAERLGVSQDVVTKLANEVVESSNFPISETFDTNELVSLLGIIHSLGCYHLPLTYNEGTSQKPLGAYYTPTAIADYVVSLTLSPTLDQLSSSASTKGVDALQEILSLQTLDPACGTGVFLVSSMNAYQRAMKKGIQNALDGGTRRQELKNSGVLNYKQRIRRNMNGVDIDSGALEVTDISLRLLSQDNIEGLDESSLGDSLKQGNSLVSFKDMDGQSNYRHYFSNADSRLPFEWNDEFGGIIEHGGFHFIVMNPPYERLKPNLAEFLRERLLSGEREIHMDNFSKYKQRLREDVRYFRDSDVYHLGNRYGIDTYRLFIERTLQLAREGGSIGFIVPSTILGDLSSQPLRRSLIRENKLRTVDDFPETSRLFEGVTQSVSVITLERGGSTNSFSVKFGLKDIDEAKSRNPLHIQAGKIESAIGPSLSIPQVNKVGWRLLSKLHNQPSISSLNWLEVKRGELDLTLDKECITNDPTAFRLVRGSNISRYTLNDPRRKPTEFVDIELLGKKLGESPKIDHIRRSRIACQQVSNRTQRWRLKFASISPNLVLANSCNYLVSHDQSLRSNRWLLLGVLNSELMNWRFNLTNTNNHVSNWELTQLPLVNLETSTSQNISTQLKKEVKRVKTDELEPKIEALVFALYDFSPDETQALLKMRSTPQAEINAILQEVGSLDF